MKPKIFLYLLGLVLCLHLAAPSIYAQVTANIQQTAAGQSLTNLQTALENIANVGDITFNSSTAIANGCFLVKHWNVQSNHFYIR